MKRTFRLTALILALVMLVNISALATTEGYPVSEVDRAFYNRILQSASQAAQQNQNTDTADVDDGNEETYDWGYVTTDKYINDTPTYGGTVRIPANTLIKVLDKEGDYFKVEYNGTVGYIIGSNMEKCECANESTADPATHYPDCVYPKYFNELANTKSAEELYTMWSTFTTEEQAYILTYLETNNATKHDELLGMLNPPVVQPDKEATTEDGTKVTVKGSNIPADVTLNLSTVTDTAILDSVLPGFDFQRASYFALDVSLWQNSAEWQPANGDTMRVTISVNENVGKPGDYFALYHKHGNEQTTDLGLYAVANDGTITFDMDRFSFVFGVNVSLCTADCWFNELKDLPTATDRYKYLLEKRDPITEYDTFMYHYRVTHSASNLVCICQYESVFKYVDSIYAPGDPIHKADCPWAFKNLTVEEQAALLGQGSAPTANGFISGVMPAGAVGVMDSITANEDLVNALIPADMFAEGTMTTKAFDIKLNDANGNAWMPTEPVTVQLNDIVPEDLEDPLVAVIHLLSSAEAITKEGSNVLTIDDPAIVVAFPEEAAAAQEAGLGNVIAYTALSNENGGLTVNADGSISFETSSFSDYYVSAGSATSGYNGNNWTEISNGEVHTFHVEPGTIFTFNRTFTKWTPSEYSEGYDQYFRPQGNRLEVTSNAPIGATVKYTVTWSSSKAELTFIVTDRSGVVDGTINNDAYPVLLSLLRNTTTLPAEPGVSNGSYTSINSGDPYRLGVSRNFSATAYGIVSPDIKNVLVTSVDGSSVLGLSDPTGINTKKYLSGIDWDAALLAIATHNDTASGIFAQRYNATDGNRITRDPNSDAYYGNYELIPYVVKLMTVQDAGWHIDCAIVPANRFTLSYNLNLDNYTIKDVPKLPSAVVGTTSNPINNVTVGSITGIAVNSTITAVANGQTYTLKFLGWNTDPTATTATYIPNQSKITVTKDTILYAIWQSNVVPPPGTLIITKDVAINGNYSAPNDSFTFTVTYAGTLASELNLTTQYTITNASGVVSAPQPFASGNSFQLADGEVATIINVPIGSYTVTETPVANYTTSAVDASGFIRSNATSLAAFTNTYSNPTGSLTINKTVVDELFTADKAAKMFQFTVTPSNAVAAKFAVWAANNSYLYEDGVATVSITVDGSTKTGSVTLTGLPEGEYTVAEVDDPVAAPYTVNNQSVEVTVESDATATASFTNSIEYVDVKVSKIWDDNNNAASLRPSDITVTLSNGQTAKLNSGNNWTYTWQNLPKHTNAGDVITYTVSEEQVDNYKTPVVSADSDSGENFEYTITNTIDVTDLSFTKKVVTANGSAMAPADAEFTFKVTLTDGKDVVLANKKFSYIKNDASAAVEFETDDAGAYTFTAIKANDKIVIKSLTIGTKYTVEEQNLPTGFTVDKAAQDGTLNSKVDLTFTNTYTTHTVTVNKVVEGVDGIEADETFTFQLKLDNANLTKVAYTKGTANDFLTLTNGEGIFTLKNGESIVFTGIPYNGSYTVTETMTDAQKAKYDVTNGTVTGTLTADAAHTVTNAYKTGSLTVTKKVSGDVEEGQRFIFTVTGPNNYSAELVLGAGQSITLTNLPYGDYVVTEDTNWAGRYATDTDNPQQKTVSKDNNPTAEFTNTRKDSNQWLDANAGVSNNFSENKAGTAY